MKEENHPFDFISSHNHETQNFKFTKKQTYIRIDKVDFFMKLPSFPFCSTNVWLNEKKLADSIHKV